jgi:hypothetical protein
MNISGSKIAADRRIPPLGVSLWGKMLIFNKLSTTTLLKILKTLRLSI